MLVSIIFLMEPLKVWLFVSAAVKVCDSEAQGIKSDPSDPFLKTASERVAAQSVEMQVRKWVCEARRNPEPKPELHIRAFLIAVRSPQLLVMCSSSKYPILMFSCSLRKTVWCFFSPQFELQALSEGTP